MENVKKSAMRHFDLPKGCGKNRYPDKKAAASMANFLKKRESGDRRRGRQKNYRIYCCPDCKGWHLSSK